MTGRIETSKTSLYLTYFYVKWTTAQDSINNKTTVDWEIHLDTPRESWYSNAVRIDYLKINNTTVKSSLTYSNIFHTDYTLASGSNSFSHDSNGNLTLSFSFSGWLYGDGTFTAAYSLGLPSITVCTAAAISSVTSLVAFGSNCTINITKGKNNDNNNCTYKLTYSCNGQTGTILNTSSSSKPSSHLFSTNNFNLIKNNASNVTCTLTLTTYWNNNSVGSSSKSFVIVIPNIEGISFLLIDYNKELTTPVYSLIDEDMGKPIDWDTNKTSYYKIDDDNYVSVESTDVWAVNTYYYNGYYFDGRYKLEILNNFYSYYTYKVIAGTLTFVFEENNKIEFYINSNLCPDAEEKEITFKLDIYNGTAKFNTSPEVKITFKVPNANNYYPSLGNGTIVLNQRPTYQVEGDFYCGLRIKPINWNTLKTRFYKIVDDDYVLVENGDVWATGTYYAKVKDPIYALSGIDDLLTIKFESFSSGKNSYLAYYQTILYEYINAISHDLLLGTINFVIIGDIVLGNYNTNASYSFYVIDARGRTVLEPGLVSIPPIIYIDNYSLLSILNITIENPYASNIKFPYSLKYSKKSNYANYPKETVNLYPSFSGSKLILSNNNSYDLEKVLNEESLKPSGSYLGSSYGKTLNIKVSLYGREITYTKYFEPQERVINFNKDNKIIRIGSMAGDIAQKYEKVDNDPGDFSIDKYYVKADNIYMTCKLYLIESGISEDLWYLFENFSAWYIDIYVPYGWGLVVGNFDLTITDTEIAILKNKFGI